MLALRWDKIFKIEIFLRFLGLVHKKLYVFLVSYTCRFTCCWLNTPSYKVLLKQFLARLKILSNNKASFNGKVCYAID